MVEVVVQVQEPPATVFMQESQCQIPHCLSLHLGFGFVTKGASFFGVLNYFTFLHHFPEEGTLTGPVFTNDCQPLSVFSHVVAN